MKIKRILSGEYVENCYICSDDDKNCFIVDPGEGFDKISEYIESNELKPSFILLTHGHGDHIGAGEHIDDRCIDHRYGPPRGRGSSRVAWFGSQGLRQS